MKYYDVCGMTAFKGKNVFDIEDEQVRAYENRVINEVINPLFSGRVIELGDVKACDDFTMIGRDEVCIDWIVYVKAECEEDIFDLVENSNIDGVRMSCVFEALDVSRWVEEDNDIKRAEIIYKPQIEDCIRDDEGGVHAVNAWDGFTKYASRKDAVVHCYRLAVEAMTNSEYAIEEGHFHAIALVTYKRQGDDLVIDDVTDIVPDVERGGC